MAVSIIRKSIEDDEAAETLMATGSGSIHFLIAIVGRMSCSGEENTARRLLYVKELTGDVAAIANLVINIKPRRALRRQPGRMVA